MTVDLPMHGDDFTADLLTQLISATHPGTLIKEIGVTDEWTYGSGQASAAARVALTASYEANPADLPAALIVKIDRADSSPYALYANEVAVYSGLKPSSIVTAPTFLGGAYDEATGALGLVLEDLRARGATFPNVLTPVSAQQVTGILDELAKLHATFWESPRLSAELGWMQTHTSGEIHSHFTDPERRPAVIRRELDSMHFKREMVQRLGSGADELAELTALVQQHQSTLPQTVLHGDAHIGNTYRLPDGSAGLLDWQLSVRGFCMHDIAYLLATALSIEDRRRYEVDLIGHYAKRLEEFGAPDVPSTDMLWTEYRLAAVWGVYIGWLTTPVKNYGWEITVGNLLRVTTAVEDLGTLSELRSMAKRR